MSKSAHSFLLLFYLILIASFSYHLFILLIDIFYDIYFSIYYNAIILINSLF